MLRKATLKHISHLLNPTSQVVLRADFNVPINNGSVTDPNRIKKTIPTIMEIMKHKPKSLVMLSHLGRPQGRINSSLSLKPIANYLASILNRQIVFLNDCIGHEVVNRIKQSDNEIFICQNLRFHPEEKGYMLNDQGQKVEIDENKIKKYRKQLSKLGGIFVNDAFGTSHRAHSSMIGINHQIRAAGLLLEKQITYLQNFLQNPQKPVLTILGGSKVSDKIELIENMLNIADEVIIGGGMGYPFLQKLRGYNLGKTNIIMPQNQNKLAEIVQKAANKGIKLHYCRDVVAGHQMTAQSITKIFDLDKGIPQDFEAFDCGPKSRAYYDKVIRRAKSIFWNGPLGVIQIQQYRHGSLSILKSMIEAGKMGAQTIIGGGDTAALANSEGLSDRLSYISTGGGASLHLLQGVKLPGIQHLTNADSI